MYRFKTYSICKMYQIATVVNGTIYKTLKSLGILI